jgi:hypothetical protein
MFQSSESEDDDVVVLESDDDEEEDSVAVDSTSIKFNPLALCIPLVESTVPLPPPLTAADQDNGEDVILLLPPPPAPLPTLEYPLANAAIAAAFPPDRFDTHAICLAFADLAKCTINGLQTSHTVNGLDGTCGIRSIGKPRSCYRDSPTIAATETTSTGSRFFTVMKLSATTQASIVGISFMLHATGNMGIPASGCALLKHAVPDARACLADRVTRESSNQLVAALFVNTPDTPAPLVLTALVPKDFNGIMPDMVRADPATIMRFPFLSLVFFQCDNDTTPIAHLFTMTKEDEKAVVDSDEVDSSDYELDEIDKKAEKVAAAAARRHRHRHRRHRRRDNDSSKRHRK